MSDTLHGRSGTPLPSQLSSRRAAADLALAAVAAAGGLALARLLLGGRAWRDTLVIVGAAVCGHLLAAFACRGRRRRGLVGGVVALGGVALGVLWGHALVTGTRILLHTPAPVPDGRGVLLAVALGAGLVGVVARVAWAWSLGPAGDTQASAATTRVPADRQLVALAPFTLVVGYSALVSADRWRAEVAVVFFVTVLLFVAGVDGVADATGVDVRPALTSEGDTPRGVRSRRRLGGGLVIGLFSTFLLVLLAPGFSGMHLTVFLHGPSSETIRTVPRDTPTPPATLPSPSAASPSTTLASSSPTTVPIPGSTPPTPQGFRGPAPAPHHRHHPARHDSAAWWVLLSGALGVLAVGVWLGIYLQHRQRPSAQHPVLAAWNRAVDALDRADLGRLPTETPVEHAARLGTLELDAGRAQKALDAMATLADLAELALYSADPGGEREAHVATQLAEEVHETLRSRTNRIELHAASRRAALREGATR